MRRDQISIDRFEVANASFWLDQVAVWLAEPGHADQLAADLWPAMADTGPPLRPDGVLSSGDGSFSGGRPSWNTMFAAVFSSQR